MGIRTNSIGRLPHSSRSVGATSCEAEADACSTAPRMEEQQLNSIAFSVTVPEPGCRMMEVTGLVDRPASVRLLRLFDACLHAVAATCSGGTVVISVRHPVELHRQAAAVFVHAAYSARTLRTRLVLLGLSWPECPVSVQLERAFHSSDVFPVIQSVPPAIIIR